MKIQCKVDNKIEIFSIGDKQKADKDTRTIEDIQREIEELRNTVPKDPGPDPGEAYSYEQWKASLGGNLTADTSPHAYDTNSEVASQRANKERYDQEKTVYDAYKKSPLYTNIQQPQERLLLKQATISPETLIFEDSDIHKDNGSILEPVKAQLQSFGFTNDQISDLDTKAKIIHGLKQKVAECLQNPLASAAETKYLQELGHTLTCQDSLSGRLKDFYKTLQKPPEIEFSEKAGRFFSYCTALFTGKITGKEFLDYLQAKEGHIIASKVFKEVIQEKRERDEAAQEFKDTFTAYSNDPKKIDEAVMALRVFVQNDKSFSLSELKDFFDTTGKVKPEFNMPPKDGKVDKGISMALSRSNDALKDYGIETNELSDKQKIVMAALIYKVNTEVAKKHDPAINAATVEMSKKPSPSIDRLKALQQQITTLKEISSNSDTVKKFLKDFNVTNIAPESEVKHTNAPM